MIRYLSSLLRKPKGPRKPTTPRNTGQEKFGETLVRLGYITPEHLQAALHEQDTQASGSGETPLIGLLLLKTGFINSNQLVAAIRQHRPDLKPPLSESVIRIATRIRASLTTQVKVISVAGLGDGDGASALASQLSVALSMMGEESILLIDANSANANLHHIFETHSRPGLMDILDKGLNPDAAIVETMFPALSLLPAGFAGNSFFSLLLSQQYTELLKSLRSRYRLVIINPPPLLEVPEAMAITSSSDGVVLVLARGKRRKSDLIDLKQTFDRLNINVFGFVLTDQN